MCDRQSKRSGCGRKRVIEREFVSEWGDERKERSEKVRRREIAIQPASIRIINKYMNILHNVEQCTAHVRACRC